MEVGEGAGWAGFNGKVRRAGAIGEKGEGLMELTNGEGG
jgi:hypothetical protein